MDLTPVDINYISQCLKRIKRYTHRKQQIKSRYVQAYGKPSTQTVQNLHSEIQIFKQEKHQKIQDYPYSQPHPFIKNCSFL